MFIRRSLTDQVAEASSEYPVIAIVGPRQSGKTTLAQMAFPLHRYVSLEDFDVKDSALSDPRKFLTELPSESGIILDEIQNAPELLSYMQTIVDREKKNGFFIVTGSQNFLVDQAITQTLAGRMAVLTLLPLSIQELEQNSLLPTTIESLVFKGSYPKAHAQNVSVERLYKNYLRLYVERDVRQIKNVADLATFQKFMKLCAGRIGQVVNLTSLGNDCGISHNTAKEWLSLLEASYVIFQLQPYYQNFGKRLIKSPKIYFVDSGVACSLLNIRSVEELESHYLRGGLVEGLIISDLLKQQFNLDRQPSLYFWRDHTGHEIDCIIDESTYSVPVEIKSGKTVTSEFFKEINFWSKTSSLSATSPRFLIYGGADNQSWSHATVLSWKFIGNLVADLSNKPIK